MPKLATLTRNKITRVAKTFKGNRHAPKWNVIVEGVELPARPLVIESSGLAHNHSMNSHQAVTILKRLGFETRYDGKQYSAASRCAFQVDINFGVTGNVAISSRISPIRWVAMPLMKWRQCELVENDH
jgi:hypothetical protein